MFDYLDKMSYGENIITNIENKNEEMLMDISIVKLRANENLAIKELDKEVAVLILDGEVKFNWDSKEYTKKRTSLFDEEPCCLHISRNTEILVTALEDSEVLVQKTNNSREFEAKLYDETNTRSDIFGDGVAQGTCRRIVRTIFDYFNAPYSNMVMGEVITYPGRWSSYPPHHHPQPEVYLYRFDKPQGFGACFIGDEAFKIKHNSVANIRGELVHPQTSAPGYAMYYCWMIRHLKDNPWTSRIDDENHTWVADKDAIIWDGK